MTARIAFLDRDGTLNTERSFVRDPDQLELLPGAVDALRRLRAAHYRIVVVTNQSGIARGLYDQTTLARIHERLHGMLERLPSAYLHCPHHPEQAAPYGRDCDCRKPGKALFADGLTLFGGDAAHSFAVGDSARDVLPALELGMPAYLVASGKPVAVQERVLHEHAAVGWRSAADLGAAVDEELARRRGGEA